MRRNAAAVTLGLAFAVLATTVPAGQAAARKEPGETRYDLAQSLAASLGRHVGERVELILISGTSLKGTVKDVGSATVHLTGLEGREYFDAVVRVEQIGAFVVRAR
jgi:hypothetical protein